MDRNLFKAIRDWLYRHGFRNADELTIDDIVELATGNIKALAKNQISVRSSSEGSKFSVKDSNEEKSVMSKTQEVLDKGNAVWGYVKEEAKKIKQDLSSRRPIERDELGEASFGLGKAVYSTLARNTQNALTVLDHVCGNKFNLKPLPSEFRKAYRSYKASLDNSRDQIAEVAELFKTMDGSERRLLSDVVEKMVAPGVNPPEHVLKVATAIQNLFDAQTDQLLSYGLISPEAAEKWRGQYLPRIYFKQSKLLEESEEVTKDMFKSSKTRGMSGSHFKGRGMFKTAVGEKEIAQYKAMGWEVRDPDWSDAQDVLTFGGEGVEPAIPTVQMWRDFTPEERRMMGEERDAMVRVVLGYMQTQEDIALAKFFSDIASNPNWASNIANEGWVRIPDSTIGDGSPVKRYGKLAGLYVHLDIWAGIESYSQDDSSVSRLYRTFLSAWKEGKTALNPVAHMNNTIGNVNMAHFAGVSMWNVKDYMKAFNEIYHKSDLYNDSQ